jgi:hypothetical protein
MVRKSYLLALVMLTLSSVAAQAAQLFFTYDWTASNIFDSGGDPPPNALLTTMGTFTVAFDPEGNPSLTDVPIVASTPFTDNEGVTLTATDIFSTVRVRSAGINRTYEIFVGGIVSALDTARTSVGDTNDFRLQFIVKGGTGADVGEFVSTLPGPFDVSNGGFGSLVGDLSVNLVGVSADAPAPIPLPAGGLLLLSALALTGWRGRRRS